MTLYTEGFSHFVASMTAPIASGWSKIAGWDSHPLRNAALTRRTPTPDLHGWSAMDTEDLTVIADAGYFKRVDILSCHESDITAFVPRSPNLGNRAKTAFGKKDFRYLPENDEYRCPANERLIWRMTTEEAGLTVHRYWSANCQTCALKSQCTHGKERRVTRWEHEAILEAMQERLECDPDIMRVRRQTVEHPYGTLKLWMGSAHFLTRTLKRVSAEMSLQVLAYNLKRVMNILGVKPLIQAIQA